MLDMDELAESDIYKSDNITSSQSSRGAPTNSSQSTTTTTLTTVQQVKVPHFFIRYSRNDKTPLDEAFEKLGSDLRDITRTYVITESNLFRMAVGSEEEACKKNA